MKSSGRLGPKTRALLAGAVAAVAVLLTAVPAHADADVEWRGISCNYGYFTKLHSNGANYVSHTQRHVGTNQATNKSKSWNNPIWGTSRAWGYGYQSSSFSEVYTSNFWISSSNQYWDCA